MADCKFKVGDRVAVKHYSWTVEIRRVERVLKLFVVLDDGSKWKPSGYGRHPRVSFDGYKVFALSEVDEERVERDVSLRKLTCISWSTLTTDQLRRVMAIVNEKGAANGT